MNFPATALRNVIHINVVGRVFMSCVAAGISDVRRIAVYVSAVEEAMGSRCAGVPPPTEHIQTLLDEQIALLERALESYASGDEVSAEGAPDEPFSAEAESGLLLAAGSTQDEEGAEKDAVRRTSRRAATDPLAMEEKLKQARKPIQKILREDCVQLGLVGAEDAERLVRMLAGRTRDEGEAQVVAELRNSLHQQIRRYIRKHKGGPWPSPKSQDDLRVDIVATRTVHGLLTLTRQILRERTKWESVQKKGVLGNLLGGKLKLGA
jgi:hypothetical protein